MRPVARRLIFSLAFLAVLLMGCTAPVSIMTSIEDSKEAFPGSSLSSTAPAALFSCENDPAGIRSRAYVVLMGLGETQAGAWRAEKSLLEKDPLAEAVLIYPQDETLHVDQIRQNFLSDMHVFLKENPVDELVLFGSSAGGVTASYSIAHLDFSGPVALHTMASPLKGYDLTGFRASFLGDRQGYLRDIAIGFQPFDPPGSNVKVYHHKTVTDSVLLDYCGEMKAFCDVRQIQDNDLAGSREFFYPQYDHATIMSGVIQRVAQCYNPRLTAADLNFTRHSATDISRNELPGLCAGAKECESFCRQESYACETYCMRHDENAFCQEHFSFVYEPGYVPLSKKNAEASDPLRPPASLEEPRIEHIGIELGPYDPATGRAGDFLFTREPVFHDKIFQEYGDYIVETPDRKPKYNPQPTYLVPLGTPVRALTSGVVTDVTQLYSGDYSVMVAKDPDSPWRYETEHVVNPIVKPGDRVVAGQIVAEASPHGSKNGGLGLFEIGILRGGNPPTHVCPFAYLAPDVQGAYAEKIKMFYRDWEAYRGNSSLYDEDAYEVPGCLTQAEVEG